MVGVAEAIRHDLNNGLLVQFKALVQAGVFADFLEMGEHLLQGGYKDAAAVIIDSVLEDGLRKLAEANRIPLTQSSGKPMTIEPLNVELASKRSIRNSSKRKLRPGLTLGIKLLMESLTSTTKSKSK